METLVRSIMLYLSKSKFVNKLAKQWGLRFGAQRFVAGESIHTAIAAVRELNRQGIIATLDHLGEFVSSEQEARKSADDCIHTLDAIDEAGVQSNLSLKLTQLGLDVSKQLCLSHMRRILERAKHYGNFVRIDMEDYAHNEMTMEIYQELVQEYGNTVGLVLQAYLYKVEDDLEKLSHLKPNLRLVKGAYKESPQVAFPQKQDVDRNYVKIIEKSLQKGHYTAIATHDTQIITHVKKFTKALKISHTQFEFQMLFGIRVGLQQELAQEGYTVRVYVPYGIDWYGYFMRRLAERPANIGFVIKSMFKK